MIYIKKCIVTIVNKEYVEIFNKFLYFYNKNCLFDLIVYTVNFDNSLKNTEKIKYIPFYDSNLIEYEFNKNNEYIKNFSDQYKYLVALKPKIINQSLLLNYDCFLYLDADCVATPYLNKYYSEFNDISQKYPLCPVYKDDFMIYNGYGSPFQKDGTINLQYTIEGNLFDHFNINQNRSAYRHTYAYVYNKNCKTFFEKAFLILSDLNLFKDYNKYFPLLDETVFNFLFWVNDFKKSLGIFPFVDMYLNFKDLQNFENFINKNKIACLHAKFYKKTFDSSILSDFTEIDHEKYSLLEKLCTTNKSFDLYYNFTIDNEFIVFNFLFLEDKIFSIHIINDLSTFLYKSYNQNYAKNVPYFISIPYDKNGKIELIFLNEKDSIVYTINETFNN